MKKAVKIILGLLLTVVLTLICFALFIQIRGIPSYDVQQGELKVELSQERIARGQKLAGVLCANCHANPETGKLTGREMLEAGDQFGKLYSRNITASKEHGIASWTDWEIYYLLRTGIKRDGQYAPPYMAKLPHMADEDVYSIIAYLRSGEGPVAAAEVPDKACEPSFLTKMLCTLVFKPLALPEKPIIIPDSSETLAFGKYLAINLDCWTCHSEDFKTMDVMNPPNTPGYFGGGNPLVNEDGEIVMSKNLTPDKETGIGLWSEEKFVRALKTGLVEGREPLRMPMVPYNQLTDTEAKAIYAYLRTVPAIKNKVVN